MDNRSDQEKQLEAFINRLAGEAVVNHAIGDRFIQLEVDARADMLKGFAERFGVDPSLIDDFDLQGIESSDFVGFLVEAWVKCGAARPMFGRERRFS